MPFDSHDLRYDVFRTFAGFAMIGHSTSEDVTNANAGVRRQIARNEIWGTGGGSLNQGLDCNSCNHVTTCPGDRCRRKDC